MNWLTNLFIADCLELSCAQTLLRTDAEFE